MVVIDRQLFGDGCSRGWRCDYDWVGDLHYHRCYQHSPPPALLLVPPLPPMAPPLSPPSFPYYFHHIIVEVAVYAALLMIDNHRAHNSMMVIEYKSCGKSLVQILLLLIFFASLLYFCGHYHHWIQMWMALTNLLYQKCLCELCRIRQVAVHNPTLQNKKKLHQVEHLIFLESITFPQHPS